MNGYDITDEWELIESAFINNDYKKMGYVWADLLRQHAHINADGSIHVNAYDANKRREILYDDDTDHEINLNPIL